MTPLEAYDRVLSQLERIVRLMEANTPAMQSENPVIRADAQRVQQNMRGTVDELSIIAIKILADAGVEVV